MTQVREDLEATYDYLEEHGWCQGTFRRSDGKVCLEGAAAAVTMGAPNYWGTRRGMVQGAYSLGVPREDIERYADVYDALAGQLPEYASLFLWNDATRRTVEEVKDLIKAAIKAETDRP